MDINTARRIDGLLANETFPTFVNPIDIYNTLQLKQPELFRLIRLNDKAAIEKCCYEIAAITINFLERGLVSP